MSIHCSKSHFLERFLRKKISEKNFSRTFAIVEPQKQKVSKIRSVPDHIEAPTYVKSYKQYLQEVKPIFNKKKTPEDIANHRSACKLARRILDEIGKLVKPGVTTDHLDSVAHQLCIENNAYPSPLLYRKFPKSICTSVNNVACHGIPDDRPLQNGDVINIDVTVYKNNHHGDVSYTYPVGDNVDNTALHLISVAKLCRDEAIKICRPGQRFNAIGKVISEIVRQNNMTVVPDICGHGIGQFFHGPPEIIHTANDDEGTMKEGMTFTIEPVVCLGEPDIEVLNDGWTIVTRDNSMSAQFEHTILITSDGFEILTL
ncbi:hypothetical protein HELRODRAFT_88643 [Helobdella robusta]|uniref:Methionine aminopeptidase n=1 Tax=Helobdella robusta TaxID=6412 RepID=T1G748_HELRO|nr:hypothetical protein HELRODRAFT_88643 [Helobdella robusta]ESN93553.1 hypothetical protein HELRODRAFT_88643 [Helobdella robusta]